VMVKGRLTWNPQAMEANARTTRTGSNLRIIIISFGF
jgi:hypothetical protein